MERLHLSCIPLALFILYMSLNKCKLLPKSMSIKGGKYDIVLIVLAVGGLYLCMNDITLFK